jgi:hypothetical protein
MEEEWKLLTHYFHQNMELYKHFKQFNNGVPDQYKVDVKKIYDRWLFQKEFVIKSMPLEALPSFNQMLAALSKIRMDYFLAGINDVC